MFYFGNKKGHRRRDGKTAEARRPRLDRRNAVKNIDYEASWTSASSDESTSLQTSRSLDFSPVGYSSQSSFRIGGSIEGEVEHLYRSLGLSGPEDFAIPIAAWEASLKVRSSSDVFPRSRWLDAENPTVTSDASEDVVAEAAVLGEEVGDRAAAVEGAVVLEEIRVGDDESAEVLWSVGRNSGGDGGIAGACSPVLTAFTPTVSARSPARSSSVVMPSISTAPLQDRPVDEIDVVREEIRIRDDDAAGIWRSSSSRSGRGNAGVKGARPPVLIPPPPVSVLSPPPVRSVLPLPPSMALPVCDRASSTWDIVKSFAPADENEVLDGRRSLESDEDDDESDGIRGAGEVLETAVMEGETSDGAVSFSTSIDDDSSSTTTEIVISPNGRFKKKIRSWIRGDPLGSGSFGTVYEGISE